LTASQALSQLSYSPIKLNILTKVKHIVNLIF